MSPFHMTRARLLIAGLAILGLCSAASPRQQRLREASFFIDREDPNLLPAIRKGTDRAITFNGHFSLAYVSCGIACGSYWIVDRRTGGVALVPELWAANEMTWDVKAKRTSDIITVIYGPRDSVDAKCVAQRFRWIGKRFAAIGKRTPATCPN